jgi:hypothetical protein
LTGYRKQGVASLTVQGCLDICDSMAYAYAGLECEAFLVTFERTVVRRKGIEADRSFCRSFVQSETNASVRTRLRTEEEPLPRHLSARLLVLVTRRRSAEGKSVSLPSSFLFLPFLFLHPLSFSSLFLYSSSLHHGLTHRTGFITLYQSNDDSCPIPAPSSALPSSIKPSSSIAASSASIAVSSSVAPKPSSSSAAASIPTGSVGTWSNLGCTIFSCSDPSPPGPPFRYVFS